MKSCPEFASCQEICSRGDGCGDSRPSGGRLAPGSLNGPRRAKLALGLRCREPVRTPGSSAFPVSNFVWLASLCALAPGPRKLPQVRASVGCGAALRRGGGGSGPRRGPLPLSSPVLDAGERGPAVGLAALVPGGKTVCPEPSARRPAGAWERRAFPGCYHLVVLAATLLIFASFAFFREGRGGEVISCLYVVSESGTSCLTSGLVTLERNGERPYLPSQPVAYKSHLTL